MHGPIDIMHLMMLMFYRTQSVSCHNLCNNSVAVYSSCGFQNFGHIDLYTKEMQNIPNNDFTAPSHPESVLAKRCLFTINVDDVPMTCEN